MRSAFLSILILSAAALISFGTHAESKQAPQLAKPATQVAAQPAAQPVAQSVAQQIPGAPGVSSAAPSNSVIQPKPAPPGMMTVILDPAHGAPDPGARGASGVTEADVVLDFARAIRVSLESQGFRVLFTREGNQDPSFDERSALVNSLRDVVFVSLHVSSTGPIGTVRTYSYVYPAEAPTVSVPVAPSASESANQSAAQSAPAESAPAPAAPHAGLVQWDQAQRAYLSSSEQLASLVQIQLAQRFAGSPDVPLTAAVRQLRSIAAPAIAVEVSSVAVTDPQQLARMGQPLADAISRALIDFRAAGNASARSSGGVR